MWIVGGEKTVWIKKLKSCSPLGPNKRKLEQRWALWAYDTERPKR